MDIDFGKRIRTLGEIKKILAKTKKAEKTPWKSDKPENPPSPVIIGFDGCFLSLYLQKSRFIEIITQFIKITIYFPLLFSQIWMLFFVHSIRMVCFFYLRILLQTPQFCSNICSVVAWKPFPLWLTGFFYFLLFVIFYWIYIDIYGIIVIFRGDYYAFKKNKN